MSPTGSNRVGLPKGVTALRRPRGGRGFRATIRKGKGVQVHLGLYRTPWLAAFAYGVASRLTGRPEPHLEIPPAEQPGADDVREITERVRARLGLVKPARHPVEIPPETDDLLALFEVAVVGFWREQAASDGNGHPGAGLDAAAGRLAESARLLFWSRSAGHPTPLEAMSRLLARRLEQTFRRADLAREVLDDDGDDPFRVARWLVWPDAVSRSRVLGFRDEVRLLYPEFFRGTAQAGWASESLPDWAEVLGISAPFDTEQIRAAYRARSRETHPDAGGSDAEFVRLREAYEDAMAYCEGPGF